MPTTTMLPSHLKANINKPRKQAQPDDLTSVTYVEDDTSSSIVSFHAPIVKEVLSSSSSSPYQTSVQNEVIALDSDSSSNDDSESSDSSVDFPKEEFEDAFDDSDKDDLDEASEIFSRANLSVAISRSSPDENADWKASSSTESFHQQEAVLEDMVRNLTLKLAEHQKKNERYVELFSSLEDTHEHIRSLNQRAKILEASLAIQDVTGRRSRCTKKLLVSETESTSQSVTSLGEQTSRTAPSVEPSLNTTLGLRAIGVVTSVESHPFLDDREQSIPSLSEQTSRTVPSVEARPPLGDRQQSVPNRSQHAPTLAADNAPTPVRSPAATARSFATPGPTRGKQQEKVLVAKHASSPRAAPPTRCVQSEESSTSMVVALAGQAPTKTRKIVRKVRMVPRKTEPKEFDLRSPCKEECEDDEAAFQVKIPEFASPTSSKRSTKKERVRNDIPKNLVMEIPFPAEELVAPVMVKLPSVQDTNNNSSVTLPSSAGRRPAKNQSANRVVMDAADYRENSDLKKTTSLRSFGDTVTPVPSSARRRLTMMHQSANKAMALGDDQGGKLLNQTSSVRSIFTKSKKVLSSRCMMSGANGFLHVSETNQQEGMQASFFGLDDFNEVDTAAGMITPSPFCAQSELHQSSPEMKVPLFDIRDSDVDDGNYSGRKF